MTDPVLRCDGWFALAGCLTVGSATLFQKEGVVCGPMQEDLIQNSHSCCCYHYRFSPICAALVTSTHPRRRLVISLLQSIFKANCAEGKQRASGLFGANTWLDWRGWSIMCWSAPDRLYFMFLKVIRSKLVKLYVNKEAIVCLICFHDQICCSSPNGGLVALHLKN